MLGDQPGCWPIDGTAKQSDATMVKNAVLRFMILNSKLPINGKHQEKLSHIQWHVKPSHSPSPWHREPQMQIAGRLAADCRRRRKNQFPLKGYADP